MDETVLLEKVHALAARERLRGAGDGQFPGVEGMALFEGSERRLGRVGGDVRDGLCI